MISTLTHLNPSLGNIGACEYLTAAVKCCLGFFTAYQDQLALTGGGGGATGSPGGRSSGLTSSGRAGFGLSSSGSPKSPSSPPLSATGGGLQFARVTMCVDIRCMYYLLGLYGRTCDQGKVVQGLVGMGCMFSLGSFSSPSSSTASSSSSSSSGHQNNTTSSHSHHNNSLFLSLCQKEYLQVTQELEFVHVLQMVWSGKRVDDIVNKGKDSIEGGGIELKPPQHNKENTSDNKCKHSTTTTNHIILIKPSQSQQSQSQQQSQSSSATDLLHRFISTSQQLLHHGDDGKTALEDRIPHPHLFHPRPSLITHLSLILLMYPALTHPQPPIPLALTFFLQELPLSLLSPMPTRSTHCCNHPHPHLPPQGGRARGPLQPPQMAWTIPQPSQVNTLSYFHPVTQLSFLSCHRSMLSLIFTHNSNPVILPLSFTPTI